MVEMSLEEYTRQVKERINILINANGGYWIVGNDDPTQIGQKYFFRHSIIGEAIPFTIVATATEEEARKDAETLGLRPKLEYKYYYKAVCD